jgi:hypothetical protein
LASKFYSGFSGSLQAFAEDSLIIGESCEFNFPSAIGIFNQNINAVVLNIKKASKISGSVFICQRFNTIIPPIMVFEDEVKIHGQVYCPGVVEIYGNVIGNIYCHSFAVHTNSAYYENYLYNVTIDRHALSGFYGGAMIFPDVNSSKVISWVN